MPNHGHLLLERVSSKSKVAHFKRNGRWNIFLQRFTVVRSLICQKMFDVRKEYCVRRHYETHHKEKHEMFTEKCRTEKLYILKYLEKQKYTSPYIN